MGEVVTLQIGSFSNFIGSHFWNIQQEQSNIDAVLASKQQQGEAVLTSGIRSSALWSEHEIRKQVTYRPRLVAVDLQGALGGLHQSLYPHPETDGNEKQLTCWTGKVVQVDFHGNAFRTKHPFIKRLEGDSIEEISEMTTPGGQTHVDSQKALSHQQFNFESTVRYFSDFFTPDWEPQRHMSFVPDYFYQCGQFDSYFAGQQLAECDASGYFWDRLTDQIRNQFELSDRLGAVHLLVDWETGFGGIGARLVEWIVEQAPRTSVLVSCHQPVEEVMDEKSSEWTGIYRRAGGSLFLKTCLDELNHDWNSCILSDFNLASLNSINKEMSESLSIAKFNLTSLYEASAFPGLVLDLLSTPYRLEGGRAFAARQFFESINLNNKFYPLMSVHLGCPIASDLLSFPSKPETGQIPSKVMLSLVERLWDVSTSPTSQPARIFREPQYDISSLTEHFISRGLSQDQEASLVSQLPIKEHRLCHPDPIPVPVAFPQLQTEPKLSEISELSSLLCVRPMTCPSKSTPLKALCDSIKRVIALGRHPTLESQHRDIERSLLLDVGRELAEMVELESSPLSFD